VLASERKSLEDGLVYLPASLTGPLVDGVDDFLEEFFGVDVAHVWGCGFVFILQKYINYFVIRCFSFNFAFHE
jgi:hypothetical protein